MYDVIQTVIFILGALSIWLISRKEKWKRWGYITNLIGQPFWIYVTYIQEQWGMFALSIFYVYTCFQGIYFYWIKE